MTDAEKLATIKTLLDDGTGSFPTDEKINSYIGLAEREILAWKYHLVGGVPADVTNVSPVEEVIQIYAVVAGYTHAGAEGEQTHIENGVHRHFMYEDMVGYIHNHILPYARVGAVN